MNAVFKKKKLFPAHCSNLWAKCPPNIVRVPVGMDNELGRTDGDGVGLRRSVQAVFSQVNSVGTTAAWPQTHTHTQMKESTLLIFNNTLQHLLN